MSNGTKLLCIVLILIEVVYFGGYYLGMQVQKQPIIFMPSITVGNEGHKVVKIIQTSVMTGTFEVLPVSKVNLKDFEIVSGAIGINGDSNTALSAILNNLHQAHKDKVLIMISTRGGSLADGITMCDTIKFFRRQDMTIYTYANGYCHSAGILLLQAGEKRYMSQHATMILHNPYVEDEGNTSYIDVNGKPYITTEDILEGLSKANAQYYAVLKESSKGNKELLKLWQTPKDHELTPRDALRLNLIDGVL